MDGLIDTWTGAGPLHAATPARARCPGRRLDVIARVVDPTPPLSSRRRLAGRPLSFRDVPPFGKGSLTRRSRPPRRRDPIVVRASGGSHQALSRATAVAIGHHPPPKHIFTPTTVIAGVFSAFPIVALFLRRKELLGEEERPRRDERRRGDPRIGRVVDDRPTTNRATPRGVGSIGSPPPRRDARHVRLPRLQRHHPNLPEVAAMEPFLWEHFGNPSSGHAFAAPCRDAIHKARGQVASMLGCDPTEVVFTSCGSESDNHAIASAVDLFVAKNRSSDSKPNAMMNKLTSCPPPSSTRRSSSTSPPRQRRTN